MICDKCNGTGKGEGYIIRRGSSTNNGAFNEDKNIYTWCCKCKGTGKINDYPQK
jgi:RecJ-like exonuclease